MNFCLFVILNGLLLVRPEEILPDLAGARLYLIVIGLCTLTSFPRLLIQLSPRSLSERPITVCVVGLIVAVALSQIVRLRFDVIDTALPEFGKVVLYYLLFMANVDNPKRMIAFMGWLVVFVIALATLGLLQYHELINIESLQRLEQHDIDPVTGEVNTIPRLRTTGIYNDPNDLCLILTTGSMCCLGRSIFSSSPLMRALWLCPLGLFGYATMLTYSRGGLLGLMAAISAFLYSRFGWKKFIPLAVIIFPVIIVMFAGRQMNISTGSGDTAQERIQVWAEGLSLMMRNPVTGIGVGQYGEEVGLVAHNSFIHAFVELGIFGGTLFLGAFYLAAWGPWRAKKVGDLNDDRRMLNLEALIVAMVCGYAVGVYSLSRNYVIPTYLVLGFSSAFMAMNYDGAPRWFRFGKPMVARLGIVGLVGFVFLKLFTRTFVQFG